jgi:hypothetical protein
MDTPIRLTCDKYQVDFLGEITNRCLKRVTNNKHNLDITTIKWVLGKDFIEFEEKY